MSWCQTRRSTSPTETSPSTSVPSSSPATTSRRRSRLPFVATLTSKRAGVRASTRSSSGSGRARVERSGSPASFWANGSTRRSAASRPSASTAVGRASSCCTSSAAPTTPWVDREGKPAGWRGYLGLGAELGNRACRVDPRGHRVARGASRPDPAPALRHGGRPRPSGQRWKTSTSSRRTPARGEAWHDRRTNPGRRSARPGCRSPMATRSFSTASISRSPKARSSPSSGRTAPARRPWSASCRP